MTKTDFTRMVRKIVREEVRSAMTDLIVELRRTDGNRIVESSISRVQPTQPAKPKPKPQKKSVTIPKFSDNKLLNNLLAETAVELSSQDDSDDFDDDTYQGEDYDIGSDARGMIESIRSRMYQDGDESGTTQRKPQASGLSEKAVQSITGGAPVDESLHEALTRDYSKLMKAVLKKK